MDLELVQLLTDCACILDVVKPEWAKAWTEWDQSVRDRITKHLREHYEPPGGLAEQIEQAKRRIAGWPPDVRIAMGLPDSASPEQT